MSMLDAFFNKGFKGARCKTLLKLTIPRIKLLRNRREIQLKHMRRDIAKLLENGQEATARIRVEHIIREVNMMAAQEIIELFCELISVRLPIIETQRECPLDLKEAISSLCFAAPRCSDLPELQQVQMLFAAKYGKEFVAAATELMPDCGVNRKIIELLSVRTPSAEEKLKLLKDIAEEHELDWDPAASETELLKPHEDLLNGPNQFISASKLPVPEEKHAESLSSTPIQEKHAESLSSTPIQEKHAESLSSTPIQEKQDESLSSTPIQASHERADSDTDFDSFDLPEVPKVILTPSSNNVSDPEIGPPPPASAQYDDGDIAEPTRATENNTHTHYSEPELIIPEPSDTFPYEDKQFLPFISPPSLSSASFSANQHEPAMFSARQSDSALSLSRTKSEGNVDLQDVLAAAQAAAESAELAAAAARSAASLAQVRITELVNKRNDQVSESSKNPFHMGAPDNQPITETQAFVPQHSFGDNVTSSHSFNSHPDVTPDAPSYDSPKLESEVSGSYQRTTSLEDDPYFSYPNLFTPDPNLKSGIYSSADNSQSTHKAE
ncbi:uncharacterized protein LOC143848068 [Tasmannia lanceolata]|uniref:uncharacterized protein LOC143848068 n=1 Tax=Tasmannia lanceolata TaxID=3420 RepID=UPI004064A711